MTVAMQTNRPQKSDWLTRDRPQKPRKNGLKGVAHGEPVFTGSKFEFPKLTAPRWLSDSPIARNPLCLRASRVLGRPPRSSLFEHSPLRDRLQTQVSRRISRQTERNLSYSLFLEAPLVNGKFFSEYENRWNLSNLHGKSYGHRTSPYEVAKSVNQTAARCRAGRRAQVGMGRKSRRMPMPENPSPAEMQPEERLIELARLFAKAYDRFRLDGPSDLNSPAAPPISTRETHRQFEHEEVAQ